MNRPINNISTFLIFNFLILTKFPNPNLFSIVASNYLYKILTLQNIYFGILCKTFSENIYKFMKYLIRCD